MLIRPSQYLIRQNWVGKPQYGLQKADERSFLKQLVDHARQAPLAPPRVEPVIVYEKSEHLDRILLQDAVSFAPVDVRSQIAEQRHKSFDGTALIAVCQGLADIFPDDDGSGLELAALRVVTALELDDIGDPALQAV
jgi:hypothetical protein